MYDKRLSEKSFTYQNSTDKSHLKHDGKKIKY